MELIRSGPESVVEAKAFTRLFWRPNTPPCHGYIAAAALLKAYLWVIWINQPRAMPEANTLPIHVVLKD